MLNQVQHDKQKYVIPNHVLNLIQDLSYFGISNLGMKR